MNAPDVKIDPQADIASDLRAAFKQAATPETPAAGAATEPAHGGETPSAPATVETPEPAAAAATERQRLPDGRFAKMGEPVPGREKLTLASKTDAPAAALAPAAPVAGQPAASIPTPPSSWSVPSKAAFKELPAHVQADIAKREAEVSAGFKQYGERTAVLREIEPVLHERMGELTANGRSVGQSLNMLFAAGDMLANDTPAAIVQIANNAGIDLGQLAAQQGGQPRAQPQGALPQSTDPMVQSLAKQIHVLTQRISQDDQQRAQAERTQADSEIAAFASQPDSVYFENVREDMAWLIQNGRAANLQEAYQTACRMHPEVSAAMIESREKAALTKFQTEQASRASAARKAGSSLTGAPSPGSVGVTAPKDNLRSELTEAFRAHRA